MQGGRRLTRNWCMDVQSFHTKSYNVECGRGSSYTAYLCMFSVPTAAVGIVLIQTQNGHPSKPGAISVSSCGSSYFSRGTTEDLMFGHQAGSNHSPQGWAQTRLIWISEQLQMGRRQTASKQTPKRFQICTKLPHPGSGWLHSKHIQWGLNTVIRSPHGLVRVHLRSIDSGLVEIFSGPIWDPFERCLGHVRGAGRAIGRSEFQNFA